MNINIKEVEKELRLAFGDKRFKFSNAGHEDNTINRIEDILIRIAKLNDAVGQISYTQSYYNELFGTSRNNYSDFNFECSDIINVIEDEQDNYINIFISVLNTAYNNNDILEILSFDMPNVVKILKIIRKRDDYRTKCYELIKWLHDWLTYVSYEEDSFSKMYLYLDKEIKTFYNEHLKEDKKE